MKKHLKYVIWLKWLLAIILFFVIFKYSFYFLQLRDLRPHTISAKIFMNVGIFIVIFVAIGVHELGHLIIGLKNGFRFELFVVGLLGVKRADNKIKFYLNKNLGYFGGVATTSPVVDDKDNAKKFAQVLIAGPVASVLFTVICFIIIPFVEGALSIVIYTGAMVSLALFFATTIPSRTGMFFTDRKRYQRLVNPGKAQEVELAILKIMATYVTDNSCKNIDKNDIEVLINDELPFFQFYGLFLLICYQLEIDGTAEQSVLDAYQSMSKRMSKSVVASFNKEIEILRKK